MKRNTKTDKVSDLREIKKMLWDIMKRIDADEKDIASIKYAYAHRAPIIDVKDEISNLGKNNWHNQIAIQEVVSEICRKERNGTFKEEYF